MECANIRPEGDERPAESRRTLHRSISSFRLEFRTGPHFWIGHRIRSGLVLNKCACPPVNKLLIFVHTVFEETCRFIGECESLSVETLLSLQRQGATKCN
jgi:hypothetical protein